MATLKATIEINSAPAVASLKATAGEGDKAAKQIQDAFKSALSAKADTTANAKAFDGIRSAALAAVNEQKSALAALIAAGQQGSTAFDTTKTQLIEATKEAKRLDDALEQVNKEVDDVNNKKISIGDKLKEGLSGSNLGASITGGLIGGGVAGAISTGAGLIISGLKSVIDVGSQYETALASVSAVTGVTGAGLTDIGDRAQGLAAKFGGAATTQLSAFQTILSKFGPDLAKSPEALSKVSESVNVLAKAAGLDAAQAVDVLTNSMLQFGVDAKDPAVLAAESARFINVLAASAKEGAAEIPQVGEAILAAGVAARGANLSFEETNAAVQALAIGGKVGAEAGTGLRNVIGKLIDGGKEQQDVLKSIGLDYKDLGETLTTKGLAPALAKLQAGFGKFGSDAEKAAGLSKLFGAENSATAGILLGNVDKIKAFTTAMTGTSEASKQAETNMATFSEFSSRVSGSLGNIQIAIFQGFQKFASLIVNTLQPVIGPLIESVGGAFERVWSIIKPILAVIGGLIIANIVITIQATVAVLRTAYEMFNRLFDGVVRAIQPAIDAVKKLFGIDGEMGKGIDVMKLFQDALAFVGESFTAISGIVVEVGSLVIEFMLMPLQAIVQVIAGVITKVKEWFGASKESNEETKKGKGILDILREAFANIQGTIAGVTEAFREIKTVISEFFAALAEFDIKKALAAFTGFGGRVSEAFDRGFNASIKTGKDALVAAAAEKDAATAFAAIQSAINAANAAAATQTASQVAKGKRSLSSTVSDALAQAKVSETQAAELQKLIDAIKGKSGDTADEENAALKAAKERYELARSIAEEARKQLDFAVKTKQLNGELTDEQAKVDLKKNELSLQDELITAYEKAFKVIKNDEGFVSNVGFKVNKAELSTIKNEFDTLILRQLDLRLDVGLGFDVKALEKSTKEAIKHVQDLFKLNAEKLAEGAIDPDAFSAQTALLEASLGASLKALQDQLASDEVRLNPKLVEQVQEQIDLVGVALGNLSKDTVKAVEKAFDTSTKKQIDTNKRKLELLKTDEVKNAVEIQRLLEENLALETNLKLNAITVTGEARVAETALILREAEAQAAIIAAKFKDPLSAVAGFTSTFLSGLSTAFAALSGEQAKLRSSALAALKTEEDDLRNSLKDKTTSIAAFYKRQGELRDKASAQGGNTGILVLDALRGSALTAASSEIGKMAKKSFDAFKELAVSGADSMKQLGEGTIALLGGAFAQAAADGKISIGEMIGFALDGLNAVIPILVAQIFGTSFATLGPIGGALASAGTIAAFMGLVGIARAAVGADKGVVAITEAYKTRPSSRDTIPVMMRKGESAIVPEATAKNASILEYFNKTHGRWQDYALSNLSREEMAKALNLKSMGITFERDTPRLDIASQPQVVVLQQNNEMLERELRGLRKEIKNLKQNISTVQEVIVTPRVDPSGIVKHIDARNAARIKGH